MTLAILSRLFADVTGFPFEPSEVMLRNFIRGICAEIKKEGTLSINGFGTFKVQQTKKRKWYSPDGDEAGEAIPPYAVKFKASPALRVYVTPKARLKRVTPGGRTGRCVVPKRGVMKDLG